MHAPCPHVDDPNSMRSSNSAFCLFALVLATRYTVPAKCLYGWSLPPLLNPLDPQCVNDNVKMAGSRRAST